MNNLELTALASSYPVHKCGLALNILSTQPHMRATQEAELPTPQRTLQVAEVCTASWTTCLCLGLCTLLFFYVQVTHRKKNTVTFSSDLWNCQTLAQLSNVGS